MSTDSPMQSGASADLPTTSSTAISGGGASASWSQFGNGNNIGSNLLGIRKRRVSPSQDNNDNQIASPSSSTGDLERKDNNLNNIRKNSSPFSSTDKLNRTGDCGDGEGPNNSHSTTGPSPTAYSFSGSALGSESVSNIKDKLPSTTNNVTNNNDNATKTADNATNNTSSENATSNDDRQEDSLYECNICLDTAKDAVVSMCGHLFCWPCLHQWLETRPNRMLCPVCKAAISKDKVIPLYGRNSTKQEDPRNKVPPRPAGQRTEPEPQTGYSPFGFEGGLHMSFGIGAFPFGYFASSFNFGEPRPAPANRGTAHYEDEQQLSKLFLYLAFLCIAWLLFA